MSGAGKVGGSIGAPVSLASSSAGVWRVEEITTYRHENVWPGDPYWQETALLLQESLVDKSRHGLTLTGGSGITLTPAAAKVGAYGFDMPTAVTNNQRVVLPTSSVLDINSQDFTFEGWFYSQPYSTWYGIVFSRNSSAVLSPSEAFGLVVGGPAYGGVVRLSWIESGSSNVLLGTTDVRNAWHHVAITRSGNDLRLFVDGVIEASIANANTVATQLTLSGGHLFDAHGYYANNTDNQYTGKADQIRLTVGVSRYNANFAANLPVTLFPSH